MSLRLYPLFANVRKASIVRDVTAGFRTTSRDTSAMLVIVTNAKVFVITSRETRHTRPYIARIVGAVFSIKIVSIATRELMLLLTTTNPFVDAYFDATFAIVICE